MGDHIKGDCMTTNPIPIFDGHNDVLLMLPRQQRSFFERSEKGHIDLPRAKEGGLGGGFFAVYVPSKVLIDTDATPEQASQASFAAYQDESTMPLTPTAGDALPWALAMITRLFLIVHQSTGQVRIAR